MPSYVVKINKEEDFYVYWSDITESPHCWGTRDEVSRYMRQIGQAEDLPGRFARADRHGTSAMLGDYAWEDSGFIFEQRGFLKRANLGAFLRSFDSDTNEYDLSVLHPFEDEEEVRGYGD